MLNKENILELAKLLSCDSERYDQSTFGRYEREESEEACGTFCCMAGFLHAKKIGLEEFNNTARRMRISGSTENRNFAISCVRSGAEALGIPLKEMGDTPINPQIFQFVGSWPDDLQNEYRAVQCKGGSSKTRVRVALKALSRLREDGTIDPDPNAIHTEIPELMEDANVE
jgi:hypothetical protein